MTATALRTERPQLLKFLPQRLFVSDRPLSYLALAWPLVTIPALLLSAGATALLGEGANPNFPQRGLNLVAALVLVAPMLETLIMGAVLEVLRRIVRFAPAVLLSALGWGIAHSLSAPAWGLVIWWPFLIFSAAFLVWRPRGFWAAWALVSTLHGLNNLPPALLVAFGQ